MADIINQGAPIIFMRGEETAGVVGDQMRQMLDRFAIGYETADVSVAGRITSRLDSISAVSRSMRQQPNATLVKEPTVTPNPAQLLEATIKLEKEGKLIFKDDPQMQAQLEDLRERYLPKGKDHTEKNRVLFAYAVVGAKKDVQWQDPIIDLPKKSGLINAATSPNAIWRKELGATLLRGTSSTLEANLTSMQNDWSSSTPLEVIARPTITDASGHNNTRYHRINKGNYSVSFEPADGSNTVQLGTMNIEGDDTPLRLYHDNEAQFKNWFNATLDDLGTTAQIIHGLKQTVITIDYSYIAWMDEVLQARGQSEQIADFAATDKKAETRTLNSKILVDNVNGYLAENPPPTRTALIAPNASYASYVETLQGIKEHGGFKRPKNSEIVRAASTKDHYAKVDYTAEQDGTVYIKDAVGNVIDSQPLKTDDLFMTTNFDRERVRGMVEETLKHALKSGRSTILFGYDKADPYYGVAFEELERLQATGEYDALTIKSFTDKDATVEYFTSGAENTILMLGNIQGDFATDIELAGKGTSYSVAILDDGRLAVETGSLGTAPDLLGYEDNSYGWKQEGILRYVPTAFVEAYAFALRGVSQNLANSDSNKAKNIANLADKMEEALYKTTHEGLILPFSSGNFIVNEDREERHVSFETFMAHIELEMVRNLKGSYPGVDEASESAAKARFDRFFALDKAVFGTIGDHTRKDKFLAANWSINSIREAHGDIDPEHPDYAIRLPAGVHTKKINANSIYELRQAQATFMQAVHHPDSEVDMAIQKRLVAAYITLGLAKNSAEQIISELTRVVSS